MAAVIKMGNAGARMKAVTVKRGEEARELGNALGSREVASHDDPAPWSEQLG